MRKFLTRRNIVIALIVLVGGWWWWNGQRTKSKLLAERKVVEVSRGDVALSVTVSGEVKAEKQAILNFPSSGKLAYVNVREGDRVKRYQSLVGMDTGDLKAAETAAYYNYLAADANAKEVEDDLKGKGASENFTEKNTRVTAQTTRDKAYDAWLTAQRAVRNSGLSAPFAGVVTGVTSVAVGDTIGIADGVTVVDPESLYFEIEVDETDLGKIEIGQEIIISLDAFEGENFKGRLENIGFVSELSNTGATVFPAKIRFEANVVERLRIGMNGDAEIELGRVENVLRLPVEAVVDGKIVMDAKDDPGVDVEVGMEGDEYVEIKSGVTEGQRVVIK